MAIAAISMVVLLTSAAGAGCRPGQASNFGVETWQGRTLDGKLVVLKNLRAPTLVLNVYSPTCKPCIDEIPALNHLKARCAARGIPFYMIADRSLEVHGLKQVSGRSDFDLLQERLRADVRKHGIKLPLLIMDAPFQVARKSGLVTATPETLIFKTRPLRLHYNFLGPVSTAQTEADLKLDTRFQFLVKKLGL